MNKPLILVVEDDNSVKNLITTTLKAHNPDIILLDLGLPDIDGVDVIKKSALGRICRLSL